MKKKFSEDLKNVPLEDLEDQITELAGHLNAANYRWLTLIAEFDRRKGWWDGRLHSCAHWLNFKCGLNLGAAREKLRTAHALEKLPRIAACMARGQLSYSKVRALTRIACKSTEENLLMIALHGTAHHVEKLVRHYSRAEHAESLAREARQEERSKFSCWYDDDGSLVIRGRVPALIGALFEKAMEAAMELVPATEPDLTDDTDEALRTYGARRSDALALLAEAFLQRTPEPRTADRYQVVVHVNAATLGNQEDGRCELEQGPGISSATVRRLSCDSSLVCIVENDKGEPLNVGRKTRSIPPALRRALDARDAGCCFPGCTFDRFVDAHHVRHWAEGGETKLENLVTLCRSHHRMVHTGDIVMRPGEDGGWRFSRSDGRPYQQGYTDNAPSYEWNSIHAVHEAERIRIGPRTAVTRWTGERMDYDLAVFALCSSVKRGRRVAAET